MKEGTVAKHSWGFTAFFGLCLAGVACGDAQSSDVAAGADAVKDGTLGAQGTQLAEHAELLSVAPTACAQYEAENIGRAGGAAVSGGWKLTNAGDNINQTRMFVAGAHAFSIFAKGTAGGGQSPQIKLTLNGIQIGGNINVTATSTWTEYVVNYSISTANNKQIKVELANPGSGRTLSVDGINVYCPRDKVVCGSNLSCSVCCHDQTAGTDTCSNVCGNPIGISFRCDQPSDCAAGSVCAARGNPFNGVAISCQATATCDTSNLASMCWELCKSPSRPEWGCSNGGTCTNMSATMPGWKQCIK